MNKEVDLEADTIKVALMNVSHAFTATHNTWSQVSANELSTGGGYTSPGQDLAGKAVTQAATTDWDGTDSQWTSATFSAYHAVLYDDSLAGDDLICSIDFGGEQQVTGGTFTIQWNGSGIITLA
jgi:hypothetical protein